MHYTKFMELKYPINRWLIILKQQPFVLNLSLITMIIKPAPFLLLMKPTLRFVELKAISGSSWMPPNVPSSVTGYPKKCKINFDITQVIGLTNDDVVSKAFRPYKQMIERLNRTYKQSYRPSNGFDNIDGANYDLSLWVANYNFLRPHKHAGYKVLNKVDKLEDASNMPGKWQLLIFLGQQQILKMQQAKGSNCS